MAKNNKNNKANTNKQKSIVIPKKFLEQYKIKLEGVLNGRSRKIKPEPTDAVEQTLSASAAIKGKPYVSPNNNSKTADFIRQQNAKGDSPARDYYRNKKIYDKQFENYVALLKKKERFAKNSKIADLITSDPNYITKSAAPMDNTIIYFDKPLEINDGKTIIIEPTSTEIPTPQQQLASLTLKPLPETPVEKVLAYAPTAAVAAPIAYMATTGGVFPLATSIWNNPISWGTSMGLGYLGSEGVNSGVRLLSNYKYNSWGDMLGDTDTEKFILEFTNPGGWAGGIKGWSIGQTGDDALRVYQLGRLMYKSSNNPIDVITPEVQPKVIYQNEATLPTHAGISFDEALTLHSNLEFARAYNRWNRFGYPEIPLSILNNTEKLNAFVKGQLNRHNTFARGVRPNLKEKLTLEKKLGRKLTMEEFLEIAASIPREGGELWMSPYTNLASMYGLGKTALIRRNFTFSPDRMKWFDDASFDVQHATHIDNATGIVAPWNSKPRWGSIVNRGPESELVYPYKMLLLGFYKGSDHLDYKTSLNSNPFFTKGENYFDKETGRWVITDHGFEGYVPLF